MNVKFSTMLSRSPLKRFDKFFLIKLLLSVALAGVVLLVILNSPLVGDVKIFYASAHQSIFRFNSLISQIFQGWELKPFAWRAWNLVSYKVVTLFVPFSDKTLFESGVMSLYVVVVSVCALAAGMLSRKAIERLCGQPIDLMYIYLFLCCGYVTQSYVNLQQAEDIATLLSILCVGLLLWDVSPKGASLFRTIIVALLFTFIAYFKLVSIVLVVMSLLLVKLVNPKVPIRGVVSWTVLFSILTLLSLYIFWPGEIQNWMDAATFQKSGQNLTLKTLIFSPTSGLLKHAAFSHALLFLTIVLSPFVFFQLFKKRDARTIIFLALIYLTGISAVTVQKKYFVYHYVPLTLYGIAVLLVAFREKLWRTAVVVMFVGCSITSIFNTSISRILPENLIAGFYRLNGDNFSWPVYRALQDKWLTEVLPIMRAVITDPNIEVLYLDDGASAYFLGNPSVSLYFYPLPVARSTSYWDDKNAVIFKTEGYKNLKATIDSYDGPYVVSTMWFSAEHFVDVYARLDRLYDKTEAPAPRNRAIYIWKRKAQF